MHYIEQPKSTSFKLSVMSNKLQMPQLGMISNPWLHKNTSKTGIKRVILFSRSEAESESAEMSFNREGLGVFV